MNEHGMIDVACSVPVLLQFSFNQTITLCLYLN